MLRLWELDQSIFRWFHVDARSALLDPVFFVLSTSGLGWVQAVAILSTSWFLRARAVRSRSSGSWPAAFWEGLRTVRRQDWSAWSGPLLTVYLVSGLVNSGVVKEVLPRDRPSQFEWADPAEGFFYRAFPSGHTATAFAMAWLVLLKTRGTSLEKWGWWAMVWAAGVGISRIYRGVHWPTDVVAGAAVGIACASAIHLILARAAHRSGSSADPRPTAV
ncbi:MAG: phosphatase PAP2 family protein [Fimbriimonadaceae bacterium]